MQRIGRIIGVSDDLILEVWPGVRSLLRLRSRGLEQDGEVPPGNSTEVQPLLTALEEAVRMLEEESHERTREMG